MSFRRNRNDVQSWKNWLASQRDALLACSIPLVVLEHQRHWTYFIEHGYYTPPGFAEPVINIDLMDRETLSRLCQLLESSECPTGSGILTTSR